MLSTSRLSTCAKLMERLLEWSHCAGQVETVYFKVVPEEHRLSCTAVACRCNTSLFRDASVTRKRRLLSFSFLARAIFGSPFNENMPAESVRLIDARRSAKV